MEREEYILTSNDRQAGSCQRKKKEKEKGEKKQQTKEALKKDNAEIVLQHT